ncbi:MAG: DNA mismatch repair endonuclease MutL [Acidobacteria bacterium]|nr:DNA mismatch repair endonuclease MutL [Acidobacteriota bacterium]
MGLIRVLPDRVANQIAAGEVVERPASVVKELLENSLDAGATRVRIDVASGGRRMIRISDDGCGMNEDDAMLAFERHATSKLREVEDLMSIDTLGFRGEALPAIGSVSRLELETGMEGQPLGTRIEIGGGRLLKVEQRALPPGTTITIKDLFYNVPARRKFLRTEKTELAHVASLVTHYSLAHIDKSFHLANENGSLLQVTPVETLRERVYQVFGSDVLDDLIELDPVSQVLEIAPPAPPPWRAVEEADLPREKELRKFTLQGFVSKPQVQKLNRNAIYVFVKGRLIRDRVILKAITSAYHNMMPPGYFPFALVFLEMAPEEVDVNVHPSKTEVRFRHQSFVHDFVRDSIREALVLSKPAASIPLPASPSQTAIRLPFSEATEQMESEVLPADETRRIETEPGTSPRPAETRFDFSPGSSLPEAAPTQRSYAAPVTQEAEPQHPVLDGTHSRAPLVENHVETLADLDRLRPLGQIQNSFIVAAGPDGLWLIDQHVAHERILFEKVLRQRERGEPESQRLLMPLVVTLRPGQEHVYGTLEEEFGANGFDIEPFGSRTIAVKATPADLSPHEAESLIQEILETPEREMRGLSLLDVQKRIAATIACHAAIKVNMPLDMPKMRWLLEELTKTEVPMACPHGRPIALKYGMKDILKAFHRI